MLRRIQGARVSRRTGIIIIAITLAIWAIVVYVNIRDFVPVEFTQPRRQTPYRVGRGA